MCKKMKIKIEHIAPYLPYKVKAYFKYSNEKSCKQMIVSEIHAVYSDSTICCHDSVNSSPDEFKLVLKPLSSASDIIKYEFKKYDNHKIYDKDVIKFFCEEVVGEFSDIFDIKTELLPYGAIQWLLKNRYDIFDLIEKEQAVNYFEIKKMFEL